MSAFPTLRAGLDYLGFTAVELEFARDNTVMAISPMPGRERFKLDDPASLDEFRAHLNDNATMVPAFLMSNNFGSQDLCSEIDWAVTAIRAAEALDVPTIRIDAIMHGEQETPFEENIRIFAESMSTILDATSNSKIELGIENHGFQGNRPEFLDSVLSAVGSPRLGLTIDTGNFYWRGFPLSRVYEIIQHFAPHCKHTHAKNIAYPADMREVQREIGWEYGKYVSPVPDGDVDHGKVVAILKSAGYNRDLCLEDESLGKYTPAERIEVLKRDADHFRDLLGQ